MPRLATANAFRFYCGGRIKCASRLTAECLKQAPKRRARIEAQDDRQDILVARLRGGIKKVDDGIWPVSFMHHDLGYIDLEQRSLQTIDNPFGTRLSPMSQVQSVLRYNLSPMSPGRTSGKLVAEDGFEPPTHGL